MFEEREQRQDIERKEKDIEKEIERKVEENFLTEILDRLRMNRKELEPSVYNNFVESIIGVYRKSEAAQKDIKKELDQEQLQKLREMVSSLE